MLHVEGLSFLLEGDLDGADAALAHAYDVAFASGILPLAGMTLAERFLVATERGDWTAATSLIQRAVKVVEAGQFDGYWTSALVFAAVARAAAHHGDIPRARQYARRAAALRPLLTYALPVGSLQALLELARTYLVLADPAGARAVLDQAREILLQRPDMGALSATADDLRARVDQVSGAAIGASSLTAAEMRLVPLLPTHLSLPEIGAQLFVSRHTVKTHVVSLYRKLGVSSRGEAVDRMNQLGLLE
jgi:LuxR family maltose regulon positive regulatory protein